MPLCCSGIPSASGPVGDILPRSHRLLLLFPLAKLHPQVFAPATSHMLFQLDGQSNSPTPPILEEELLSVAASLNRFPPFPLPPVDLAAAKTHPLVVWRKDTLRRASLMDGHGQTLDNPASSILVKSLEVGRLARFLSEQIHPMSRP